MSIESIILEADTRCTITPQSYDSASDGMGGRDLIPGTPVTGVDCRIHNASQSELIRAGRQDIEVGFIMYLLPDIVIERNDKVLMEDGAFPIQEMNVEFIGHPSVQDHHLRVLLSGQQRAS